MGRQKTPQAACTVIFRRLRGRYRALLTYRGTVLNNIDWAQKPSVASRISAQRQLKKGCALLVRNYKRVTAADRREYARSRR